MPFAAKTADEVLIDAAQHIASVGWVQGEYYADENGKPVEAASRHKQSSCCLLGAIHVAAPDEYVYAEAVSAVEAKLGEPLDDWNDTPGRSKDEVIDLLRWVAGLDNDDFHGPEYDED